MDSAVMRFLLTALRLNLDDAVAAAETQRHKHKVLVNAVRYAVEQRKLPADPLAPIKWSVAETVDQVDPRVVANPSQARSLRGHRSHAHRSRFRPPGHDKPAHAASRGTASERR